MIHQYINDIYHLDVHLYALIQACGYWIYALLFLIIFAETGLVIFPFLPGDSLLFAVGALANHTTLNLTFLGFLLCLAAILGDTVNYWIGHWIGPAIFKKPQSRFFNPNYLTKTHRFYEKYGGKTLIFARFIPIIRTFAPFIAGIATMAYNRFLIYNIIGGISWICLLLILGFYFGNLPIVKDHFSLVIMSVIILSIMPPVIDSIYNIRRR